MRGRPGILELSPDCISVREKVTYNLEVLQILLLVCLQQSRPSDVGFHVWGIAEGIGAESSAIHRLVAFLFANTTTISWLVGALTGAMAHFLACAAGSREGALDSGVCAVRFVVANFAAVEAFSRELAWLCAITREVAGLAAVAAVIVTTTSVTATSVTATKSSVISSSKAAGFLCCEASARGVSSEAVAVSLPSGRV
jgi:hypothetical protein